MPVDGDLHGQRRCRRRRRPALPKSSRSRFECCFPAAIPKRKASRTHPLQNLLDPWSVRRNAGIRARRFVASAPMLRSQLTRRSRIIDHEGQSVFAQPAACADRRCLDVRRYRRARRHQELRVRTRRTDRQGRSRQDHHREARQQDDGQAGSGRGDLRHAPRHGSGRHAGDGHQGRRRCRERSPAPTGSRPPSAWPAAGSCRSAPRCRARPARSKTSSSSQADQ